MTLIRYVVIASLLALFNQTVAASEKNDAQWYAHINVTELESSQLIAHGMTQTDREIGVRLIDSVFSPALKAQTQSVTVYSQTLGFEHAVMLIQGKYATAASQKFLEELATRPGYGTHATAHGTIYSWQFEEHLHGVLSALESDGFEIDWDQYKSEEPSQQLLYIGQVSDTAFVATKRIESVQQWLAGDHQQSQFANGQVFEVVVNVQEALMHAGLRSGEGLANLEFDSQIMQKIEQASFKMDEVGNLIMLELGLTTRDAQTATQIQSIFTGLIALKRLSDDELDPKLEAILNNLQLELMGSSLLIKTEVDIDLLQQIRQ